MKFIYNVAPVASVASLAELHELTATLGVLDISEKIKLYFAVNQRQIKRSPNVIQIV